MSLIPYDKLDPFQKRALKVLGEDQNLIVAAPTGTGKTAIVDHAIKGILENEEGRVIYTGPLKALCNQKFREFCNLFGGEKVGLITGDEVINDDGTVLVMTTEVLRNMLQEDSLYYIPRLVVYDEVHYLSDRDRGAAWEESIVLLPPQSQILGLSATAPNAEEVALWIEVIKGRKTKVIRHTKRAVPLSLLGITKETGLEPMNRVIKKIEKMKKVRGPKSKKKGPPLFKPVNHLEIVHLLSEQGMLPALYFLFNRKRVEAYAHELGEVRSFTTPAERKRIKRYLSQLDVPEEALPFLDRVRNLLLSGIGYHHAGLIPQMKRLVEVLFEERLLKVVYCTSTFALGINMPARTVVFDSLIKFDGQGFRPLTNMEFFQKAGRAGRRGIDEIGYVVARFDPKDHEEIPIYKESNIEPIESSFRLSYNSVVNLLSRKSVEEVEDFLSSSLWTYQHEDEKKRIQREISKLKEKLEALPTFTCEYSQESMENRKNELKERIERKEAQLRRLEENITEAEGENNPPRVRRLMAKKRSLAREILKAETLLKGIKLEQCDFCIHRSECRATERKRRHMEKRLKELEKNMRHISSYLVREFEAKCEVLKELGHMDEFLRFRLGAKVLQKIHIEELLVTEMILEGFFDRLTPEEIGMVIGCIGRDPDRIRNRPKYLSRSLRKEVEELADFIRGVEEKHLPKPLSCKINWNFADASYLWITGHSLDRIVEEGSIYEGDLISAMRQTVDLLKQVKRVYREVPGFAMQEGVQKVNLVLHAIERPILKEFPT